ncbi:hypothetical protein H7F51_00220 [Novosphingobium flavum]|uniref:Uncharacterized protein n=1 Tax=Novosphingobium flavum TaxID=1778672 RepID=A0A7X1FN89_9SPHN|nr:hypothetical protein [Novosphingobium flavum]MBC2663934.1 hypothetical protein [Novosphingobium flavum]
MQNFTLALAGIAVSTVGAIAGMSVRPELKGPSLPDWREKYRAIAMQATVPDEPAQYTLPVSSYAYDLAAAGYPSSRPMSRDERRYAELQADPALLRMDVPTSDVPLELADTRGHDGRIERPAAGIDAVNQALRQTDGIGEGPLPSGPVMAEPATVRVTRGNGQMVPVVYAASNLAGGANPVAGEGAGD